MSTKVFKYILNFQADAQKFGKEIGGMKGMLKGAAVAAGALFAADKIIEGAKAVAEYAAEISEVKNQVQALTGLSGAQADIMTGGAQAIKQAYGEDVNEVVKASNVLMRQFGESSAGAFDILNAGLSGVANANGDFLEQVQEYSTHFREAGLDAAQMFAVIQEGNKIGVFNDKAADSIKEGSIRLREMTQSTRDALDGIGLSSVQIERDIQSGARSMFDVMRDVSAQLSTMPAQSAATGAALADIFGGPGEDAVEFIRSLHAIDTSAQAITNSLTENQKAQMAWTDELQEFNTVGAQVFGGTSTMVTKLKTFFMAFVNDAIKGTVNFINYFIDLYNESMVFRAGIEYIKFTVQSSFKVIGLVFKQFWEGLKSTGALLKAVFTGNFKEIPNIIKANFKTTIDNATAFGEDMADRFKQGVGNVLNPREKVALITLNSEAEPAGVADGMSYAAGFNKGVKSHSQSDVPDLMQGKSAGLNITVQDPKPEISKLEEFAAAQQQKAQEIGKVAISMSENVQNAMSNMFSSFGEGLGELIAGTDSIGGFLNNLLSMTIDFAKNFGETLIAAGVAALAFSQLLLNPFAAIAAGTALVAASTAIKSMLDKGPGKATAFADGGIVYGPTMGLVGEYPGASTDPEIISPLSKLKALLQPQTQGMGGNLRSALSRDKFIVWLEQGNNELAKLT
ncbi:phage tail tape measure protein [uncultured Draconibacterium sp.]|uniref:phage tail tape measure protein n=1 Tax=uncultured Draconibacterium sp. TaxID=1573823 RepID=UPI003217C86D